MSCPCSDDDMMIHIMDRGVWVWQKPAKDFKMYRIAGDSMLYRWQCIDCGAMHSAFWNVEPPEKLIVNEVDVYDAKAMPVLSEWTGPANIMRWSDVLKRE